MLDISGFETAKAVRVQADPERYGCMFVFKNSGPKNIMQIFKAFGVTFSKYLCIHMHEDQQQWLFSRSARNLSTSRPNYLHTSQIPCFRRFVYSWDLLLTMLILQNSNELSKYTSFPRINSEDFNWTRDHTEKLWSWPGIFNSAAKISSVELLVWSLWGKDAMSLC